MSKHVFWMFKADIKPGKVDELKALAPQLCVVAEQEEGVVGYQWSVCPEGKHLYIYERFADADAALVHLKTIRPHLKGLMEIVSSPVMECHGAFTEPFRKVAQNMPMVLMETFAGFHR